MAFFDGDNGGATTKGVTRDEIRVAVVIACNQAGKRVEDWDDPATWHPQTASAVEAWAAYVRYFNERYQMYGRRLHFFRVFPSCTSDEAGIREAEEAVDPFFVYTRTAAQAAEAARLGIMAHVGGPPRELTRRHAPYIVSFRPDIEDWAANVAEAACARLAGRPARYAGDPSMHATARRFGLLYQDPSRDPQNLGARLVVEGIRRRCGGQAGEVVIGRLNGDGSNDEEAIARMRLAGVTTVIAGTDWPLTWWNKATAAQWYPEWFAAHQHTGSNTNGGTTQVPASQPVFGITSLRRFGPPAEQHHRRAVAEGGCSRSSPPTPNRTPDCHPDWQFYEELLLLATGVQAAGPRLTAAGFDRGMRALPPHQSLDPWTPSAYFGPGDHSFVKDFAFVWRDPTGMGPGNVAPNCWRLVEDGLRYRAEDWQKRPGDDGIYGDRNNPCQGLA